MTTLSEIKIKAMAINNKFERHSGRNAIDYFYNEVNKYYVSNKRHKQKEKSYKNLNEKYQKLLMEVKNFKTCAKMLGFNTKNFFNKESKPKKQKFIQ